jgi:hypothetical protein
VLNLNISTLLRLPLQAIPKTAVCLFYLDPIAGCAGSSALGSMTARRASEPFRSADYGDLLYDERGLPR